MSSPRTSITGTLPVRICLRAAFACSSAAALVSFSMSFAVYATPFFFR